MNRAFEDVFGIAGAFDGVEMAGRTDKWILNDAATRAGVDVSGGNFQRFQERYCARLTDSLREPTPGKGVRPGVRRLLETLDARDDVFTALLTGNCEQGARIKLQHFDIWKFFRCGAYGDDLAYRKTPLEVASQRAKACGTPRVPPQRVVVAGDTDLDVACAKSAGARSVAVATGPCDVDTLRKSGADVVVRDLNDTEGFFRMLGVQT